MRCAWLSFVSATLLGLGGCSLVVDFDRSLLRDGGSDGGVDASVDGGSDPVMDGGEDAAVDGATEEG